MSQFQDNEINIDNPQCREEDEDLEEQKRRQEELSDLLKNEIDGYHSDDCTMNSSLTSAEGVGSNFPEIRKSSNQLQYEGSRRTTFDNTSGNLSGVIERGYKAMGPEEQLKILYDVKVREISKLNDEFNKFKEERTQETKILKNKATLAEAEVRHLQVTLSNSESLLVEKVQIINDLKQTVHLRDEELQNLKKVLEQQNLELCTYQSTVNELQLKLSDNNPFSAGTRKLNSEELQKAHQDQIIKLDTLLQEKSKKVQILEKEKNVLEEDIKKLIQYKKESENENNLTIMGLSRKLQHTQEQCKDLFLLGEALKKESDHFKERMQQVEENRLETSGNFQNKSLDKETMMLQLEKLKRMLLDKDVELNSLKAKLKFYNSDLNELFEYREVLSKMYSCEVKSCNNNEHEELIIFMQRQLQSYQQAIEDRNNQIMNLNIINKELQEKIEETIQQTRTDIKNISQKYSLPQLETMSNELKNAENTINNLKQELLEKDKQFEKQFGQSSGALQDLVAKEKHNLEKVLSQVKAELKQTNEERDELLKEVQEFRKVEVQLTEENERVKTQLQKICLKLGLSEADIFESDGDVHESNSLKLKYGQIHDQLQHVLMHLEIMNVKRTNFNIIFKLKKQIQNYFRLLNEQKIEQGYFQDKLEQWENMLSDFIESLKHSQNATNTDIQESDLKDKIEELTTAKTLLEGERCALECELKTRTHELEETRKELALLKQNTNALKEESEENTRAERKLNDQIHNLKKCLQVAEENKLKLEHQLNDTLKQLNEAKQENINSHKEFSKKLLNANLTKGVENVETILERKSEDVSGSDVFQKCLQAQALKAELALRDQLQEENIKKLQKIEDQYKKVIEEKLDMYNKEKEKWKHQETNYRRQFAAVLEECRKKMEELEKENSSLIQRVNVLLQEYQTFRDNTANNIDRYNKTIIECKKTIEISNDRWASLFESYMTSVAKIEKQHQKTAKTVLKKIAVNQTEIKLIENLYDEKIKKLKADKMKRFHSANQT